MDGYFSQAMGMGRYRTRTRGEVFASDRQYFDKILYKNKQFRHDYTIAYSDWLHDSRARACSPVGEIDVLSWRIAEGIRHTGVEKVRKMFREVLDMVEASGPAELPKLDASYEETLPGGRIAVDGRYARHMLYLKKFWTRLALPEVREES